MVRNARGSSSYESLGIRSARRRSAPCQNEIDRRYAIVNPPKVTIVVLNWNGRDDTLECLTSLAAVDYPCFDIIVVDNGSHDGSPEAIGRLFPNVEVVETGKNLGYAGGNNFGINVALSRRAEFVLLLNNDTIVDGQLLRQLVGAAASIAEGAFFSPKIYYYAEPNRIWYAGGKWVRAKSYFTHLGYGEEDNKEIFGTIQETDYACGCALFVRSSAISRVGLLDERFFLTFEESDWCYRGRRGGLKSIFVPHAKVWHKVSVAFGGSNSPFINYFMTRNRLLWGRKHLPAREFFGLCEALCRELFRDLFREPFPRLVIDREPEPSVRYAKKLYWGLIRYRRGLIKYRRELARRLAAKEFRACLYGIRDFALGRFGYQESTIQKLR